MQQWRACRLWLRVLPLSGGIEVVEEGGRTGVVVQGLSARRSGVPEEEEEEEEKERLYLRSQTPKMRGTGFEDSSLRS